ncbi:putative methyltransferase PMT12 [Platanthera guangdongensis]|uniref:Methyltransferase n=1 Tax=Platanthera guangdongensis TaxID=2320717 RepID=A0ABR2N1U1_9ASPA
MEDIHAIHALIAKLNKYHMSASNVLAKITDSVTSMGVERTSDEEASKDEDIQNYSADINRLKKLAGYRRVDLARRGVRSVRRGAASTAPTMKGVGELGDSFKLSVLTKISVFFLACVASFYLGRHWTDDSFYPQLVFYSSRAFPADAANRSVTISPKLNHTIDISNLESTESAPSASSPPPDALSGAPPRPVVHENVGIVNENGEMQEDFDAGTFNHDVVETEEEPPYSAGNETNEEMEKNGGSRVRIQKFRLCPERMMDYIPCLDNEEGIRRLKSTERGERFERHCPSNGQGLDCLVPAPKGYVEPIPWPRSRDEVWFSNVPHMRLAEDKGGQNWIKKDKEKFKFPGGGTQFIHGADIYLDQISEMVPDIAFGNHTRVVLDVGCGVASFGAFLLARNVITMSIAPKDVHENQIQFALERGVPAMVAAFATLRLRFPSQAFDLLHCSRCRINWTRDGGHFPGFTSMTGKKAASLHLSNELHRHLLESFPT